MIFPSGPSAQTVAPSPPPCNRETLTRRRIEELIAFHTGNITPSINGRARDTFLAQARLFFVAQDGPHTGRLVTTKALRDEQAKKDRDMPSRKKSMPMKFPYSHLAP